MDDSTKDRKPELTESNVPATATPQNKKALKKVLLLAGIILVGIIAFFAVNALSDDLPSPAAKTAQPQSQADPPSTTSDPTSDWIAYSNTPGAFSLKYPKTWVKASNPELCFERLVLLGSSTETVGKCATESFGQMVVTSEEGDKRANVALSGGYKDIAKQDVTINGVIGVRETGIATGQQDGEIEIGGYQDGTKVVQYIFFGNGNTYTAIYVEPSGQPSVLGDFDVMVTKTLKFTP